MMQTLKNLGVKILAGVVVFLLFIAGMIGWRSFNEDKVLADNPTDTAISFQVDGTTYTLEPQSSQMISIKNGTHTLVINDISTTFEKKGIELKADANSVASAALGKASYAVLNPTASNYVLSYELYGNRSGELPEDELIKDIFFERKVDFGITERSPDTVSIPQGQNYTIQTKLYRYDDYMAEYGEEASEA